jgi:hypothetical protein
LKLSVWEQIFTSVASLPMSFTDQEKSNLCLRALQKSVTDRCRAFCCSSGLGQFRGFLAQNSFSRFFAFAGFSHIFTLRIL